MPLWRSSARSPQNCQYGETLEDMLRDRLVCECRDNRLQCKLRADPALTFEKAMTIAKSNETAEQGVKDLSGGAVNQLRSIRRPSPQLSKPHQPTPQPPIQPCSRCGASHSPSICKFKTATYHYCKKIGHLASVCCKKARDQKSAACVGGDPGITSSRRDMRTSPWTRSTLSTTPLLRYAAHAYRSLCNSQ